MFFCLLPKESAEEFIFTYWLEYSVGDLDSGKSNIFRLHQSLVNVDAGVVDAFCVHAQGLHDAIRLEERQELVVDFDPHVKGTILVQVHILEACIKRVAVVNEASAEGVIQLRLQFVVLLSPIT